MKIIIKFQLVNYSLEMINISLKMRVLNLFSSLAGFNTQRKLIVIESDDWGSIRMPSAKTYHLMLAKGMPVDKCRYNSYDTLADSEDLSMLFEVLSSVKDRNGNPAKFTPLSLVANPDFDKIRASGFTEYHYELFTDTLKRYGGKHAGAFELWQEGIGKGIFVPQLHGREHLNVYAWLKALRDGSPEARLAFDNQMFGLNTDSMLNRKNLFMSAFEFDSEDEFAAMPGIIEDGARIFEQLFGYKAIAFMAPCAIWSRRLEPSLKRSGLSTIQTGPVQYEPYSGSRGNSYRKSPRYTGLKSSGGLVYSMRNCSFEPSEPGNIDWVEKCLSEISRAFLWRKPAIISSHRVNYIGNLVPENRERGIKELQNLLKRILQRWPDVEFMTSDEFIKLMRE